MEIQLENYVKPIQINIPEEWQSVARIYKQEGHFPDLSGVKVAFVGCQESRGEFSGQICAGADAIREAFYQFFPQVLYEPVADLGNLCQGKNLADTYVALEELAFGLLSIGCVLVVLGGSQDLTYALARAYSRRPYNINVLTIDPRFDMDGDPEKEVSSRSYMARVVTQPLNQVFNYTNLGNQSFLVHEAARDLMEVLSFDEYRYGLLRSNIEESEPALRDADLVSVDMSALRRADSPGNAYAMPTGFTAEEMCQMMRYAGMSYQVSILGLFEYHPSCDPQKITATLMAQMLWFFVEGVQIRIYDHPLEKNLTGGVEFEYKVYTVMSENNEIETEFYKCKQTDHWWMLLPCTQAQQAKYGRHFYIPCSYQDYQNALTHGMSERWWRAFRRVK